MNAKTTTASISWPELVKRCAAAVASISDKRIDQLVKRAADYAEQRARQSGESMAKWQALDDARSTAYPFAVTVALRSDDSPERLREYYAVNALMECAAYLRAGRVDAAWEAVVLENLSRANAHLQTA